MGQHRSRVTHAPLTSHRFPGNRASETHCLKAQLRRIPERKRPDRNMPPQFTARTPPLTSGSPKPIASSPVQRRPIRAELGGLHGSAGRKWAGRGPRRASACVPGHRVTLYHTEPLLSLRLERRLVLPLTYDLARPTNFLQTLEA